MKRKVFIGIVLVLFLLPTAVFATVASSNNIYNGMDVSNWQGYINYAEVKQNNIDIVYIKATQGDNIIDPYFKINYENAKENGLKIGFYHFLTAVNEEQAIKQAEFFGAVISNTSPDCKLAMDFEQFGNLSNEQINNISMAFLEKVKDITGKEVIIYSDAYDAANVFGGELVTKYPLWIAEYGVENPKQSNWQYWEGFQYSSQGTVPGVQGYVDLDKFTENILLNDNSEIPTCGEIQETNYVVQRGNTLSYIANLYNTTVGELVILNKIQNPNLIWAGETIKVPIKGDKSNGNIYGLGHVIYTVQPGNTLSELALKFNTTVQNIAILNNIKNVNLIYAGERLKINN